MHFIAVKVTVLLKKNFKSMIFVDFVKLGVVLLVMLLPKSNNSHFSGTSLNKKAVEIAEKAWYTVLIGKGGTA